MIGRLLIALLLAILAYLVARIFLRELWAGIIAVVVFIAYFTPNVLN